MSIPASLLISHTKKTRSLHLESLYPLHPTSRETNIIYAAEPSGYH